MQKILKPEQITSFYHDEAVNQQVLHFRKLVLIDNIDAGKVVVDIGGGCGYFARALYVELALPVRVIDTDPASVEKCRLNDVPAFLENAISVHPRGDEGVVCFNLILHHLVSDSEEQTFQLQKKALELWKNQKTKLFVNEYIYDSYLKNSSGWLIYQITSSRFLSAIGLFFSKFSSSLRANTFGVGVRFRSHEEWKKMFREAGFAVIGTALGAEEQISMPRRLLLIKSIRKDSFLLEGNMIS